MTKSHHLIIGLPKSGKTTFLAAFWHLVTAGEVPTKLVLDRLTGDNKHINAITAAWRECKEVPRTSMNTEKKVTLHLKDSGTHSPSVLLFPDLSGESFEHQVSDRTCNQSYIEFVNESDGIILFVLADAGNDGLQINSFAPLLSTPTDSNSAPPSGGSDTAAWSFDFVPKQVQLVELLQFLQKAPFSPKRRKLAVLISAWDAISQPGPTPKQWLRGRMPFLHQFLECNPHSFEVKIFGVSAQGGSVDDPARKAELLRLTPSQRIRCLEEGLVDHDLTRPIVWLGTGT